MLMTGPTGITPRVLADYPIFDGHNDLAWELRTRGAEADGSLDISLPQPRLATDFERLARGGVGAQFWSVYVPGTLPEDTAVRTVLEQIDLVRGLCARYPDRLELVGSADQARDAMANGRLASLIGAEGGRCIAGSLGVLRMFAALGLRYMTLTHNESLDWADSATDRAVAGGLSPFGLEVVSEMNDLGVIVDLSHVSPLTMNAALDRTEVPVLFSHSSAAGLTRHPRNVPDEVLGRLATNGGVCMVAFVPQFVSQDVADWWAERDRITAADGAADAAAWSRANACPPATLTDVADHVEHVREVAGVDHVGIGGDYDGCAVMPVGLEDVGCYPALIEELESRRWSAADLAKLTHENALRVLDDTYRG